MLIVSDGAARFILKPAQPAFLNSGAQLRVLYQLLLQGHLAPRLVFHLDQGDALGLKAGILFRAPSARFLDLLLRSDVSELERERLNNRGKNYSQYLRLLTALERAEALNSRLLVD